ncbi:glycosyltransferase family 4 protein [Campylobacter concisus]|uniref:glycosyltransferase family 4 protein n=1 Tax=Campylobacter concisus TaxID=199 RepID=UPI000398DB7F|nr:glycosyltransferase family 4 protein [Campylobacter concisus]ERJ30009.1 putative lipopolysaccharide biosynthesis protein [Campylobacter concisus ATCC 51561]
MKNVLIVSHGAALGGSPISALNIARFINKDKFKIIFVFGEDGKIVQIARNEGFKVYICQKRGILSIPLISDIVKIIKKERIALLHLNTLTSYYKYPFMAAKLLKIPTVWFVREDPEQKRCIRLVKYINRSDKIVTVSKDTAEHLIYADKKKLTTIYNGIDLQFYNNQLDRDECCEKLCLDKNFRYITTIASIEQRKGIVELIQSFSLISSKYKDVKLLIVGKDRTIKQEYLNLVKKEINRLRLGKSVILYGESQMIKEIMQISELFLLKSAWEGLSRVLLEAMACGKAIIASNGGGNKEQVLNNINGFTTDFGDIIGFSKDIETCLQDKAIIDKFEIASRKLAEEKFDIKVTTKKIEDLYNSLI